MRTVNRFGELATGIRFMLHGPDRPTYPEKLTKTDERHAVNAYGQTQEISPDACTWWIPNQESFDGLCSRARPEDEQPYRPDWIACEITIERDTAGKPRWNCAYPVTVDGWNTNDGSRFIWRLPLPLDWRFDIRGAEIH